jgi:hypothetical protein
MVALISVYDESFIEIKFDQRHHDPTTNDQRPTSSTHGCHAVLVL